MKLQVYLIFIFTTLLFFACQKQEVLNNPTTTYDCVNSICTEINSNNGEYATLVDCQLGCENSGGGSGDGSGGGSGGGSGIISYNCINGSCVDPGDGTGIFSDISLCLNSNDCFVPVTYNCINGSCVDPLDGNGLYSTLLDCETDCNIVLSTFNCVNNACIDPGDGTGVYSSLEDCQTICGTGIPPTFNCISKTCIDPLDGTGQYTSLVDCINDCEEGGSGSGSGGSGKNIGDRKTENKNPEIF